MIPRISPLCRKVRMGVGQSPKLVFENVQELKKCDPIERSLACARPHINKPRFINSNIQKQRYPRGRNLNFAVQSGASLPFADS